MSVCEQSLIVTDNHIRLKTEQKMSASEFFQSGKKQKNTISLVYNII